MDIIITKFIFMLDIKIAVFFRGDEHVQIVGG